MQLRGELKDLLNTVSSDVDALEAVVIECAEDPDALSPEDMYEVSGRLFELANSLTEAAASLRVIPEEVTDDDEDITVIYGRSRYEVA